MCFELAKPVTRTNLFLIKSIKLTCLFLNIKDFEYSIELKNNF